MGAYGQESIRAAGLRLSLAGLGVLRILMSEDGLKAAEDLLRPRQPPGGVSIRLRLSGRSQVLDAPFWPILDYRASQLRPVLRACRGEGQRHACVRRAAFLFSQLAC